ncbi:MAG: type III pantothenate kinase [Mucilaginibacter polytrichastri]|nr:type III pantothenate kinase [Mucilaginibacter polytrichastri]
MHVLAVDAGNTAIKMGVFSGSELIARTRMPAPDAQLIARFLQEHPAEAGIGLSVRGDAAELRELFSPWFFLQTLNSETRIPVVNAYKSPQTLGPDRLAMVIGAQQIFPGENSLVISAGTTITYDFISAEGVYSGGSISPGLRMRFDALNRFTAKLPTGEPDETFEERQGSDTRTSILSGVQNGILYEVEGFIRAYQSRCDTMIMILTGGDASLFAGLLKKSIFAGSIHTEPDLVLIGLNTVYRYNDQTV